MDAVGPALDEIRALAHPLTSSDDLVPLLDRARRVRRVLLGEASHGTSEYYAWRAEITRRLVVDDGAAFVAVEGDWPDCSRVNEWLKGRADTDLDATGVLSRFDRWPTWMWANDEVVRFLDWLREHNRTAERQVGFYGLDVYSLWDSLRELTAYLRRHHPEEQEAAASAWRCFEPFREDPRRYALSTRLAPRGCEDAVVELLARVRSLAPTVDGGPEAELDAERNAAAVAGAEAFYRTMVHGDAESWNVRDEHMADTLDRLVEHHGGGTAVVWAHNTHVGDARATDMRRAGMTNLGQILRERHEHDDVFIVGFSGHHGTVLAARAWGEPVQVMDVPRPPRDTHEHLLDDALGAPALFVFDGEQEGPWTGVARGHRAIGVVYEPERDWRGNWVPTVIGRRYDALLALGETTALTPLAVRATDASGSAERDTYPWSA